MLLRYSFDGNIRSWLSLITLYLAWLLGRACVNGAWNIYAWCSNHSYRAGEWLRYMGYVAWEQFRKFWFQLRQFGRWLLRVLAVRQEKPSHPPFASGLPFHAPAMPDLAA